jgi:uncharacterized protein
MQAKSRGMNCAGASPWSWAISSAALIVLALPVRAADANRDHGDDADRNLTVLHLSASAEKSVKRDLLVVQMRVEVSDPDPIRIQGEINRLMAVALDHARAVAGVKLQTGSYAVYQEQGQKEPERWRGSQGLSLSGGNFGEVLALAGELQNDGLVMSGLFFELTPDAARKEEEELTGEALKRLRQRADRIAGDLSMSVRRFRDIRIGTAGNIRPHPMVTRARAMGAAVVPIAPPAGEAGEADIEISVDADILLAGGESNAP